MSKQASVINPLQGIRVKQLIKEQEISGTELAERINLSQKTVSHICTGKQRLTNENAERITMCFQEYRKEWLLGIDDYKTEAERKRAIINQVRMEGNTLSSAFTTLAQLSGFSIVYPVNNGYNGSVESLIGKIKQGVTISRAEKAITMTLEELNEFENEICDYVEFRLSRLMN